MERPTALFLTHTIPPLRKRWDLWAKYRAEHRWERPTSGHTSYNIWDEHNHTHSAAGVFCPKEPWPLWKPYKHISVCIHLLFFSGWCTLSLSHTHTHTHTHTRGGVWCPSAPCQWHHHRPLTRTSESGQVSLYSGRTDSESLRYLDEVICEIDFEGHFFSNHKKCTGRVHPYMPNTIKSHQ